MSVALTSLRRLRRNGIALPVIRAFLTAAKEGAGYGDWDVGCHITSDLGIRRLNKRYRGIDAATDILSFSFHQLDVSERWPSNLSSEEKNLGDMVISAEYVATWCANHNVPESTRFETLIVHGLAHLMGYDHETDEQFILMQSRESAILQAASLRETASNLSFAGPAAIQNMGESSKTKPAANRLPVPAEVL
jgi:probable rRNA maturation factor